MTKEYLKFISPRVLDKVCQRMSQTTYLLLSEMIEDNVSTLDAFVSIAHACEEILGHLESISETTRNPEDALLLLRSAGIETAEEV